MSEWGKEWEVSVQLFFNSFDKSEYFNVFRVAAIPGDCCQIGQRLPAVWTQKGELNALLVSTAINDNGNDYETITGIPTQEWITLKLVQKTNGVSYADK